MKSTPSSAIVAAAFFAGAEAFWRLPCRSTTGIGRLDPIVSPGEINDHTHMAFGSGNFGLTADYDSLTASSCTSCEVVEDKSAYWTPPLYFQYDNGTAVMVPNVGGMLAYYLPYMSNITAFPEGFRMVAGNPSLRSFVGPFPDTELSSWPIDPTDNQFFLQQRALGFNCLNYARDPEPSLYRHVLPTKNYMDANCKDGLRIEMAFPSCSNGQLDSDDHKSHVAYPSLVKEGNCPKGYDTHLPFLFYETIYATNAFAGEAGQFVLSPGDPVGSSYHGDFMMGWKSSDYLQQALDTCTNLSGEIQDCPLFTLQDDSVGAQCTFEVPRELKNDDAIGPREGLPVGVPIQYGPLPATKYAVPGRQNAPTTVASSSSAPQTFSDRTDLPYTSAPAALTSNALGGIIVAAASGVHDVISDLLAGTPTSSVSSASPTSEAPQFAAANKAAADATSSSIITPAPVVPSSATPAFVSTSFSTSGSIVYEMFVEQVEVTVTAQATAAANHKRHLQQHQHHHNRL